MLKIILTKNYALKTSMSGSEVLRASDEQRYVLTKECGCPVSGTAMNAQLSLSQKTMHSKLSDLLNTGRALLFSCPAPLLSQG